jgi:hypothetical protein
MSFAPIALDYTNSIAGVFQFVKYQLPGHRCVGRLFAPWRTREPNHYDRSTQLPLSPIPRIRAGSLLQ